MNRRELMIGAGAAAATAVVGMPVAEDELVLGIPVSYYLTFPTWQEIYDAIISDAKLAFGDDIVLTGTPIGEMARLLADIKFNHYKELRKLEGDIILLPASTHFVV